jgi:predicted O-methyltransferase YrrM
MGKLRQYLGASLASLRNVALGGNARALRLAPRPRALVSYASECLFLDGTLNGRRRLPQRNVWEVLPPPADATIRLGNLGGDTWFGPLASYSVDLVNLCLLCRIVAPRVVFEIGTLRGYTTLHLALNSPPDARVYTLDVPRDGLARPRLATTLVDAQHVAASVGRDGYVFAGTEAEGRVTCLFGDSATFDYSPWHAGVDLFFIDGAHSYEYVRSDTLNALACVRPGGVVVWHDYGRVGVNGVSRWLEELSRDGRELYAVPGGSLAFMVA